MTFDSVTRWALAIAFLLGFVTGFVVAVIEGG